MSNGEAREMGRGGRHAELADVRWGWGWGGGRTTNMRGESHDTDEQVGVRREGGREEEKKCWRASHC